MDDITIQTVLVARNYLYRALQAVLGEDPTEGMLSVLFSETTDMALECFAGAESGAYAAARAGLQRCREACEGDRGAYLEAAKRDYMHVLVGPHELKAPPWECVYLTNERVLFQEATLKVREAYRSENMLPTQYPHVSDDHIAIELDFMVKLSAKCQAAFEAGEAGEYRRLLETQRGFLKEHLLVWVERYADDLAEDAPGSLYACVGKLCAAFLPLDFELAGELLALGEDAADAGE